MSKLVEAAKESLGGEVAVSELSAALFQSSPGGHNTHLLTQLACDCLPPKAPSIRSQ